MKGVHRQHCSAHWGDCVPVISEDDTTNCNRTWPEWMKNLHSQVNIIFSICIDIISCSYLRVMLSTSHIS